MKTRFLHYWTAMGLGMLAPLTLASNTLPLLNAFQAVQMNTLLANGNARYALVTRPSDAQAHRVDLVELDPDTRRPKSRLPTPLSCNRLHASLDGEILCFSRIAPATEAIKPSEPAAYVFSRRFELIKANTPHAGIISRARISADGKHTATTSFVTGHSYAGGAGSFSTATFLGFAKGNPSEQNLQSWNLFDKGARISPPDLNLWGVTFDPRNSNLFFVTVNFSGVAYLAQGNVATRRIEIVAAGIECPSFSPNGKRLAFKKKIGMRRYVPAVLDLATRTEVVLESTPGSVDDQIEWLNNHTLVYERTMTPWLGKSSTDLMSLDIDAAHPKEELWLVDARSPTFVGPR